jgi:hypothetical protein
MSERAGMATFNGVPIAIYGLSGITLVLLTLLTFKSDALTPSKNSETDDKVEEKADDKTPEPAVDEIPEAKVEEVPPMAEVVENKEETTGGKKRKNKTKRKRNKKASKTKSKRNKK